MLDEMLGVVVLLVAPWPAYRLLSIPPFRRWYRCFAILAAGALFVYLAAVFVLVAFLPELLVPAALVAAVALLYERWRSRAGHGAPRRLPPGRLSLVPRGPWVDEAHFRKHAKRYGPVFKISLFFRPIVCVIGAHKGLALFRAHDARLEPPTVRFNSFIPGGFIRYMESDTHGEYRRVLQSGFSHAITGELRSHVRRRVRDGIAEMASASERAGTAGIHPRAHVEDLMLEVLARIFIGVAHDSPEFREMRTHYRRIDVRKAACGSAGREMAAARALAEIVEAQSRRLLSADHPPRAASSALAEILKRDASRQRDETLLLNLIYMIQVGRGDMAGLIVWVMKTLADNPEWIERVRAEAREPAPDGSVPGSADSTSLAVRVVKETLRLEQSEFLYRRAVEEIEYDGYVIPKGWLIRVCIRDGHRDPTLFEEPDAFDPDRFLRRSFPRDAYHPLGLLQHGCLGGQLIELIGGEFVRCLAAGFDTEVLADGRREYGPAHWEPSSRLRLRLTPRAA